MSTSTNTAPRWRATGIALVLAATGLGTGVAVAPPVAAGEPPTTLTVTTTDDEVVVDADRSLREAITLAGANPDINTIVLELGGTYVLDRCGQAEDDTNATGDLDLPAETLLVIEGQAATVEQACVGERVLHAPEASVTLLDLIVQGGDAVGDGGGVLAGGDLHIENGIVRDNQATRDGGGAFAGQEAVIEESSIVGNEADRSGGGVHGGHRVHLIRSFAGGNRADRGGGVSAGDAATSGDLDLDWSTVAGNSGSSFAGGLLSSGEVDVDQSTIADNRSGSAGGAANIDAARLDATSSVVAEPRDSTIGCSAGQTTSRGANVDDGTTCGFTHATDRSSLPVGLRTPFLNGGSTPTAFLEEDSALLESVGCGDDPLDDQRGVDRPQGDACDVGAVEVEPCGEAFADVAVTHPFCWEIGWMSGAGISRGFDDGTYRPAPAVSRQAMSAFLQRLANAPSVAPSEPTFTDVPETHPFYRAIEWMAAEGISTGFADGTYRPDEPVSRQAMSAFLRRLSGGAPVVPAAATFTDVGPRHPFAGDVEWMAANDVSTGFGDGTFRPTAPVSRQAMSAFLYRMADGLVVQELSIPI